MQGINSEYTSNAPMRSFDSEINEFLGKNIEKYRKKFDRAENSKIGWNWCGFLFAGLWMLYRKMYKWFFVLLVVSIVLSGIFSHIFGAESQIGSYIPSLIIGVVVGMFGDWIYMEHAKKKFENSSSREEFISKGGTNIVWPIVCCVIIFAFFLLMFITIISGGI